jgi:hypothetical protein
MSQQRRRPLSIIVGLVAFIATLSTGVSAANAAPVGSGTSAFAAQAASAGLTPAQARTLQAQVDDYLAETGGTQIAANKIQLGVGSTLLLPLPGERQARELYAPAAATCDYGHMCSWQYSNYTGGKIDQYFCSDVRSVPPTWNSTGVYHNNQSTGTVAEFLGASKQWIADSEVAPNQDYINWYYIYYIDAC